MRKGESVNRETACTHACKHACALSFGQVARLWRLTADSTRTAAAYRQFTKSGNDQARRKNRATRETTSASPSTYASVLSRGA